MKSMQISFRNFCLLLVSAFFTMSCEDQDDIKPSKDLEVQNFIWKGLNTKYLWQDQVPNLADNRFANKTELNAFLKNYPNPKILFKELLANESIDPFSWLIDNYTKQEQAFQGTTKSNGIEFGLTYKTKNSNEVVGYVRYIVPNSDAATKNIKRGDIFYAVDGKQLDDENSITLLNGANENYTLSFASLNAGVLQPNGITISFTKTDLNENPILVSKVIKEGAHTIGYLVYNGFYSNYDDELNAAFGNLKAQGVTDFVLDLRYNPGGAVNSAILLGSLLTGQFDKQVFCKLKYNNKQAKANRDYPFFKTKNGAEINSLQLNKVYILTTNGTASASELIINGLRPYVEVVQIGDVTSGKNVASTTLYDSPDFSRKGINPNHTFAMQPIISFVTNKNDFGDYANGLKPNYSLKEVVSSFGTLGDTQEPLLSTAIAYITGGNVAKTKNSQNKQLEVSVVNDSKKMRGLDKLLVEY